MKDLYGTNKQFREYVDRYCSDYGLTVDEALGHAVVREVGESYMEYFCEVIG